MKRALYIVFLSVLMISALLLSAFASAEESSNEQVWIQWHKSTGVANVDNQTGIAVFTNTINGDTSFARSDTTFGMNGFTVKLKYGFQNRKSSTPNALVAPPAVNSETIATTYNMGFRIHLSSKFELNDTDPQVCIRFMPFDDGDSTNNAVVNFWVSTGTGYDNGAWIFTDQLPAKFYWDESQTNVISLDRRADGKFYLTVNGDSQPLHEYVSGTEEYIPYRNLDTAFSKFDGGKGYFIFWNNYAPATSELYASKLTIEEISSTLPATFTEGSPYGYELAEQDSLEWGYDEGGKLVLKSKQSEGHEFALTEAEGTRSLMGTGINLKLKKDITTGEYLSYNLVGENGNYAKLKLERGSQAGKANVSLIVNNGGQVSTKTVNNVDFNWYGDTVDDFAIAKLLIFREKSDFIVSINDVRIDNGASGLDTQRLTAIMNSLNNSKIQIENKGSSTIIIDGYLTKLPASMPSGWEEGTEGDTQWDSDFNGNSIVWAEDGVFSAAYKKEPAFIDNFGVNILIDKRETSSNINIIISSSQSYYKSQSGGDALIVALNRTGSITNIALKKYIKSSDNVETIAQTTINTMSWSPTQQVPIQFGIANGNWKLYIRNTAVNLDANAVNAAMEGLLESFENRLAYVQFSSEGGTGSAITFLNMIHHLPGPAVIEGIDTNSKLPVFGAPAESGDIVMSFSKERGDTIKVTNKQTYIDGFKMTFDMFATPKAGMGHIMIALAMKSSWHSLDTGIQLAITSSTVGATNLNRANVGLSMTDLELGLSNTPLVNYNVDFSWRGENTIELKKEDGLWKIYVNDKLFNLVSGSPVETLASPVTKEGNVVAGTITEILDIIATRYKGNYAYFQLWNNFGEFTMAIRDITMFDLNKPPMVKSGIKRDFTVRLNTTVRLDLNKFFEDTDGTIANFTADGGAEIVEGHILQYTLSEKDEKKYVNIRAYDDRGDFGLVRISFISGGRTDIGNMGVDGETVDDGCGCQGTAIGLSGIIIIAAAALFAIRRGVERS